MFVYLCAFDRKWVVEQNNNYAFFIDYYHSSFIFVSCYLFPFQAELFLENHLRVFSLFFLASLYWDILALSAKKELTIFFNFFIQISLIIWSGACSK